MLSISIDESEPAPPESRKSPSVSPRRTARIHQSSSSSSSSSRIARVTGGEWEWEGRGDTGSPTPYGGPVAALRYDENIVDCCWTGMMQLRKLHASGGSLDSRNEVGQTVLIGAATEGRHDIIEYCIEKGCNVNARNILGWSALHYAASEGHLKIVRMLLLAGANDTFLAGTMDGSGSRTALGWALYKGRTEVVNAWDSFNREAKAAQERQALGDSMLITLLCINALKGLEALCDRAPSILEQFCTTDSYQQMMLPVMYHLTGFKELEDMIEGEL